MDKTPPAILTADDLAFGFEAGRSLFSRLSIAIPPGVTLIRGGDGRGKTTLMRVLAGALPASRGSLQINGCALKNDAAAYRRQVFLADPRSTDFDQITPHDYLQTISARHAGFDAARLPELVETLGLAPHMDKKLFMLSTGSKRKVWLTAAFAARAPVTFIDEPFAALDTPSIQGVLRWLVAADAGQAFVIADYEAPDGLALDGVIDLGD